MNDITKNYQPHTPEEIDAFNHGVSFACAAAMEFLFTRDGYCITRDLRVKVNDKIMGLLYE
jgi:hypothetical protein